MQTPKQKQKHIPVLLDEVLTITNPQAGERYADMTAGYGGHAAVLLEATGNYEDAILVDRDETAQNDLQELFADSGVQFLQADFLVASKKLVAEKKQFDIIVADLGVSSPHIDNASRGFTFVATGPLDMRMDTGQTLSAANIVNEYDEKQLADIIFRYGEEPKSRAIARAIVQHRPIKTTSQLAEIVASLWKGHSKRHPATRTFQAIRIAVNDELGLLERALPLWLALLAPGGRLAVISFHSLEDRIVKEFFREHAAGGYDSEYQLLTKRPIVATPTELAFNPRSRSAKLRAVVKIKTKKGSR